MIQPFMFYYYSFNPKTGEKLRYTFAVPIFINNIQRSYDSKHFTKKGEPRKSIKVKGVTFYLEN